MNPKQITYILAIANTGSFTKAAKKIFISQPSLSAQITKIEKQYHIKIFKRSRGSSVEITDAGKIFISYAEKMQNLESKLKQELDAYLQKQKTSLKIGAFPSFFHQSLSSGVQKFSDFNSNVRMQYMILTSKSLLSNFIQDKLDVVFITDTPDNNFLNEKNIEIKNLSQSNICMIMNKHHNLAEKNRLSWADLDQQPVLMTSKDSLIYSLINQNLAAAHAVPNIIGYSSQVDINCQIAQRNIGIGFLSQNTFNGLTNKENLIAVPIQPAINSSIQMLYKKNPQNLWIKLFVDFMKKYSE